MNFEKESVLLRELKKYNEKAFDFFVIKYQSLIINYLKKYYLDESEAWNVSQEVFISVFKNIHSFRAESSLKTWTFKIAYNLSMNKIKYLKRRNTDKHCYISELKEKYPNYEISFFNDPVDRLEKEEEVFFLNTALNYVDGEYRDVLSLRYFADLEYLEISEILEIPVGTVKSRIYRGRERLKEKYLELFRE